jgi:UDP-GlcNAc:undecaprenyl-phosphate/decaprenyl-phosphate GlcNAc-1-phosphate transferase
VRDMWRVTEPAVPFLVAFLVSLGATLACESLARRVGLVREPGEDRWHRRPIPVLGGPAIVVGVLSTLAITGPPVGRFIPFVFVALLMAAIGLFDDLRPLRPQVKLLAEVVLAGFLIQLGFLLRLTPYAELDVLLTLFWVVGITNAVNLLDNMDGLAAGMAVIAGAFRVAFLLMDGDPAGAALAAGFTGAVLGFLVRNFPPARIFMGDAGSLFIGFFLSGLCLVGESPYSRGVTAVLGIPVLLMLIPIFDTTFVTFTRLLSGRAVSQGGRDHTSHRLVSLGISERRALAYLYGVSILAGLLAVLSYEYGFTHTIVLLTLLLIGLVLLGIYLSRVQIIGPQTAHADAAVVRLVADLPFKRQVATVAVDLLLIVVAYYSAYLLRFEGVFEEHRPTFLRTVGPVIILQLSSLTLFGNYRGLWRYTSLRDLLRLLQGVTAGVVACVLYFVFTTRFEGLSRAVFVLDWLLIVVLLSTSRVSFRLLGETLRPASGDFRRVLIYGAGDGGELMLRELRHNVALRREAVGFLDDDRSKVGSRIHDVPILAGLDQAADLFTAYRVGEVIVASGKIPRDRIQRLESICAASGVAVVRAAVRLE